MIAGSLSRVYSRSDPYDIFRILSKSAILIENWPPSRRQADIVTGLSDSERFDQLVTQLSMILANEFVWKNKESGDPDIKTRVDALEYLLYRYELDSTQYVHAQPVLEHVNRYRKEEMTLQQFRMDVIAILRSEGVIIASSNKGYKIPSTARDIDDFVALVDGQALPYLERLALARSQLLVASKGDYDIADAVKYPKLAKCLKSLEV